MPQATVASDYRIEMPEEIRREAPLTKGQKFQVFVKEGVITLVPDRPLASLRGFLKGMDIESIREKEDRL